MVGDVLQFVTEVGIPIAAAIFCGMFIYIILKFIFGQVIDRINGVSSSALSLENKLDVMNNDIVKIDTLISCALETEPNLHRIAASEGKSDIRDD